MAEADWIEVTPEPLKMAEADDFLADDSGRYGATVVFLGRVRRYTDPRNTGFSPDSPRSLEPGPPLVVTPALHYECYPAMALKVLGQLSREARGQWSLGRVILWHRTGLLQAGEVAILIGVSSSHRADAYAANQSLIDQVKRRVPIWKQEIFPSGSRTWVHPTPDAVH